MYESCVKPKVFSKFHITKYLTSNFPQKGYTANSQKIIIIYELAFIIFNQTMEWMFIKVRLNWSIFAQNLLISLTCDICNNLFPRIYTFKQHATVVKKLKVQI